MGESPMSDLALAVWVVVALVVVFGLVWITDQDRPWEKEREDDK